MLKLKPPFHPGKGSHDIPRCVFEPAECSRENLILQLPSSRTIARTHSLQNLQGEDHYSEVNFSGQWMTLRLRKGHDSTADETTEELLVLQVTKANSIEMALEELENTHVRR